MKKVTMLLLVVLLASMLLMAQAPMRLVRVTVINKSGHTIFMKLTGIQSDQFYYLTVPKGTKSSPEVTDYTLVQDVYERETWYGPGDSECEGWKTSGQLFVTKQLKLTFVPCGTVPVRRVGIDPVTGNWLYAVNYGEPSWGEKISYFKWTAAAGNGCFAIVWSASFKSPRGCYFHYQY